MTDIMQKIIEAKNNGYRYFGIRTGRVAKIGEKLVEQAIALNKKTYGGDMQYVIAGYDSEYGNDEQEIIISGATVIAIIE